MIKWTETCIRNKLIIYLASLAICLFGIFSLYTITITPFPSISSNNINIQLSYPGANATTVEKQVTSEIVANLQSINNLQSIVANTQAGSSYIQLKLNDVSKEGLLQTQIEIMQAIQAAHLPGSIPQPQITVTSGRSGLITFVVSSKTHNLFDITNFINAVMAPKFRSLPGVIIFDNNSNPAVQIALDPVKIAQYHLNPINIANTVTQNYQSGPLGNLYIKGQQYVLNSGNDFNSLSSLANLIVGYQYNDNKSLLGIPIYLHDVAKIKFFPELTANMTYSNFNGQIADTIVLVTQSDANPFAISSASLQYVSKLQEHVGNNFKITPLFNMADIMKVSMQEVVFTILIASILVLLVALLFLGRLRTTLIPIITIPICLLGAMIFINLLGMSLNIITLLAMVIAVGLVVDDAIVVVENITSCLEQGMDKHQAIIHGTSNIATTIIGITLTLLAVYVPIAFINGQIIQLIKPFAVTLASAVFISGIVALTLTPVMALVLVSAKKPNTYQRWFGSVLHKIILLYHTCLKPALKFPKITLLILIILLIISGVYVMKLPKMVFPTDPTGVIKIVMTAGPSDNTSTLKQKLSAFKSFYQSKKSLYYMEYIGQDYQTGVLSAKLTIQYKQKYLKENSLFVDKINQFIKQHHINNTYVTINKFLDSAIPSPIRHIFSMHEPGLTLIPSQLTHYF